MKRCYDFKNCEAEFSFEKLNHNKKNEGVV